MSSMVDWSKIKKEYIQANQVPTGRARESQWNNIFADIPKGQALVLREPEVSSGTIRAALKRMQAHGKFKNLKFISKGVHGSATIYVVNNEPLLRVPHGKITGKDDSSTTENVS
jgi:hypothetical protein